MTTSKVQMDNGTKPTKGLTETRYIFAMMTFLGTVLAFADRMVLNVAIVGMVDRCKLLPLIMYFIKANHSF